MLVFGSLGQAGGKLLVNGYLFDVKNLQYPQVIAKQYSEAPNEDSARQVAHRFADEIIYRLGGGSRHRRDKNLLRQNTRQRTSKRSG